jgi:hypothetical protein
MTTSLTKKIFVWTILTGLLALSLAVAHWVASGSFGACQTGPFSSDQNETVKSLDKIVDLGLKLSTALVGFGAAALIGIRSELKLGLFTRICVVIATILFAQSVLYGVWWRFGVAEAYLNKCFILASERLQWRFSAHVYFFMIGIAAIGILVLGSLFKKAPPESDT